MSDIIKIDAQERDTTKNPRQIRKNGFLPATIYGKNQPSVSVQLETKPFVLSYLKNPEATYEIKFAKQSLKVVIANLEKNYSTNEYMNVEFKTV